MRAAAVLYCLLFAGASAGERLKGSGFVIEGRDRHVCEMLKTKVEASAAWGAFLSARPSGVRLHVRAMRSVQLDHSQSGAGSYWPGSAELTLTALDAASGAVLLRRTARGATPAVVTVRERAPAGGPAERIADLERRERQGSPEAQEAALRAAESDALDQILKGDPAKPDPAPAAGRKEPQPAPAPPPEKKEKPKPRPKPERAPDPAHREEAVRLIKDLSSKEAAARGSAVRGLGRLGAEAKDAVPALAKLLQDPDAGMRKDAALALGEIGPEASPALPALLKLHQDPLAGVKREGTDSKDLRPDVRKRIEESEARARKQEEEAVRERAAQAVAGIGPATRGAVQLLVTLLQESPESSASRRAAFEGLARTPPELGAALAPAVPALAKALAKGAPFRKEALAALAAAGPAAKAAAPEAVALLSGSPEDRKAARSLLAAIGPAAVPALLKTLGDAQDPVRAAAAEALGEGGSREAVPALAAALRSDASEAVRAAAMSALLKLKPDPKEALPAVLGALKDPGMPVIRHQAVALLAVWGASAGEAALPLAEFARTVKDQDTRGRCLQALAGMGPACAPACATVLGILEAEPSGWMAREIRPVLLAAGEGAVPALGAALRSPNPFVRAQAAGILGALEGAARGAVPALIEATRDADLNGARIPAIEALGAIGPDAAEAVPALSALLNDDRDNTARNAAAGALLKMGEKAFPALETLFARQDDWLGYGLGYELGKLGPKDVRAVPFLAKGARQKGWKARLDAACALGRIGAEPDVAAEAFADLFPSQGDLLKARIADALASLGPPASVAMPALVGALGHANGNVRAPCAAAIPKVDPEGATALPRLGEALAVGGPIQRQIAAEVLGAYGAKAAGALRAALGDGDYYVAQAAAEALARAEAP